MLKIAQDFLPEETKVFVWKYCVSLKIYENQGSFYASQLMWLIL